MSTLIEEPGVGKRLETTDPTLIWVADGDERETWNLIAAKTASALGLDIEFAYAKGENQAIIEPERSILNPFVDDDGEHVLVIGRDPDRSGEYRSYRLDRIKGYVKVRGS